MSGGNYATKVRLLNRSLFARVFNNPRLTIIVCVGCLCSGELLVLVGLLVLVEIKQFQFSRFTVFVQRYIKTL